MHPHTRPSCVMLPLCSLFCEPYRDLMAPPFCRDGILFLPFWRHECDESNECRLGRSQPVLWLKNATPCGLTSVERSVLQAAARCWRVFSGFARTQRVGREELLSFLVLFESVACVQEVRASPHFGVSVLRLVPAAALVRRIACRAYSTRAVGAHLSGCRKVARWA